MEIIIKFFPPYLVLSSSSDISTKISLFFVEIHIKLIELFSGAVDYEVHSEGDLHVLHHSLIPCLR